MSRIRQFSLVALILLFGLGLRLYRLADIPFDYDRSYSPGIAIALLDSLSTGTFSQTALIAQPSSLGWPNPVLANYFLALVALFDRSPLVEMLLLGSSSTLVIAMSYDMGRRMGGIHAGLVAAILCAGSPWAVYFARGGWQLSLFELAVTLPAWLILRAARLRRGRSLLVGFIAAAVTMHIYLVGFGLLLQALVQAVLCWLRKPAWRRMVSTGLLVCGISTLVYVPVLLNANPTFLSRPAMRLAYGAGGPDSAPPSSLPVNLFALQRAFGEVGGADFETLLVKASDAAAPVRNILLNLRTTLAGLLMLIGMGLCAMTGRRKLDRWMLLAWFWAPVMAITALITISHDTPVSYYYLMLTAPAGYVLAGLGFSWLLQRLSRSAVLSLIVPAASLLLLLAGVPSTLALASTYAAVDKIPDVQSLPVGRQIALRDAWSTSCRELSAPYNPFENRLNLEYWAMGLTGSAVKVRAATEAQINSSQVWAASARGGTCSIRLSDAPEPPGGAIVPLPATLDSKVHLYLSQPAAAQVALASTSFGWSLTRVGLPVSLAPGQHTLLRFDWRIDHLPTEPYAPMRYDLFVKLNDGDGKTLAQADAASIPGRSWRLTDQVAQSLELAVPANLSPGNYVLDISLYDRSAQRTSLFEPSPLTRTDGLALVFPVRVER